MATDQHLADEDDELEIVEELSIVNEFGLARVRKLRTRNGERLEIHSPRFGHCVHLLHATLEQLPRLRDRADDTNWGARQRAHPAERHDEQKLVPQRLVDIGGDFDLHGCAFEDSP